MKLNSPTETKRRFEDNDYYHLVGVLDRILVEARTLENAKSWAFEALCQHAAVDVAQS